MKFLKSTDIFGPRIELRLGKKKSHKTFCGGAVTVSIFVICFVALAIIGEDLFYHQNPRVTFKEVNMDYDENSDNSSLNSVALSQLGINIGLFEGNGNLFDWQNGFNLNLHLVSYCEKGYRKSLEIPLRNCQIQDITSVEFKENQSYLQCVDSVQLYNLHGDPSDYPSSYFEISVTCKNNAICRQYSQLFVKLFFKDNYFTPQFFTSPFTLVSRHKQVLFQISEEGEVKPEQNYDIQIQKTTVLTEQSRFFQEFSENQFFIFKSFTNSVQKDINRPAFLLRIYLSSLNTIYERRYVTFPELLAVIGGLMKALMAIGQFLVKPIAKLSLHSQLVNELFFFEENDKPKQNRYFKQKDKTDKDRDCSRQPTLKDLFSLKNGILPNIKGETKSNQEIKTSNNFGLSQTAAPATTAAFHQGLNGQFMINPIKKSLFSQEVVLRELSKLQNIREQTSEEHNKIEEQSNSHQNQKNYEANLLQSSGKQELEIKEVSLENILPSEEGESAKDTGRMIDHKEDSFNKIKEETDNNRRFSVDQQNNGQFLERILSEQSGYEDNIESDRKFMDFIDPTKTDEIDEKIQNNKNNNDLNFGKNQIKIFKKTLNRQNSTYQQNDLNQEKQIIHEQGSEFHGQQIETKFNEKQQVQTYFIKKTMIEDNVISKEPMIEAEDNTNTSAYQKPTRQCKQSNFSRQNSIEVHINMSERSIGNNNVANQNPKVGFYPQHPTILKLKQEDLVKSNFLEGVKKFRRESGSSTEGNHHLMTKFLRRQVDIRKGKRKETSKEQVEANQEFESVLDQTHKKPLEFSWREYFSFFACKFSCLTRKKQVKYSLGKIRERFDIIYILRKLAEVDKLKVLLLTREQQRLFEFTPKPCVSSDPEATETINKLELLQNQNCIEELQNANSNNHNYGMMARWSLLHSEKSALDKFTDAFNAFKDIQKKREKEPLDERLLEMLNPEILECFNAAHAVSEVTSPFQGIRQQQQKLGGSKNTSQRRISEKVIEGYLGAGQQQQQNQQQQQPVEIKPFKHRTLLIPRTNSIEISAIQQNPYFKDKDVNTIRSRVDTIGQDDHVENLGYDDNHKPKYLPYQNYTSSNENSENCSDCIREEQLFYHYRDKSLSAQYNRDGSNLMCAGSQYIPRTPQTPVLSPKQPIYVTNYKSNYKKNPSFSENYYLGIIDTENQFSDRTKYDSCSKFQPSITMNFLQPCNQLSPEYHFMSPQSKIYSQPASPTYGKTNGNNRDQNQNYIKNKKLHKYSQSIQLQSNDNNIVPMHSQNSSKSALNTRETENYLGSYPSQLLKYQDNEQQIVEINGDQQHSLGFSNNNQKSSQLTDYQFTA